MRARPMSEIPFQSRLNPPNLIYRPENPDGLRPQLHYCLVETLMCGVNQMSLKKRPYFGPENKNYKIKSNHNLPGRVLEHILYKNNVAIRNYTTIHSH